MAKSGEKQNPRTGPEKGEYIKQHVTEWRKLGYPEVAIERLRADLVASLQKDEILRNKEEYIKQHVAEWRKLGWSKEKIERFRTELVVRLQKDEILKSLREDPEYLKIEENVEYMGYRGRKVYINLPEVKGKFEGFKFEYFVSYDYVNYGDFKKRPNLKKKSYLMKDVGGLIGAISRYMQAMGVEMPKIDYENYMKRWETHNVHCGTGDLVKELLGLYGSYWLGDVTGRKLPVERYTVASYCLFKSYYHVDDSHSCKLFLRLS